MNRRFTRARMGVSAKKEKKKTMRENEQKMIDKMMMMAGVTTGVPFCGCMGHVYGA